MFEPVIKTIDVPCSQEMAFKVFTGDLASWWPLDKNSDSAMHGEVATSVSVEAKSGDKVIETAYIGVDHHWASINNYEPYEEFSMVWHIGISHDNATLVTVQFKQLAFN